jgi:hypothetical protein
MATQRWEYGLIQIVANEGHDDPATLASLRDLNHLGEESWEAVGIVPVLGPDATQNCYQVLLKRAVN